MKNTLGFSQKIILACVIAIITALGIFGAFNYQRINQEIESNLELKLDQISYSATENMSSWLQTRLRLIEALAGRLHNYPDSERIQHAISLINQGGQFRNVFYGTEDGVFLIDDTNRDDLTGFDPRTRPWYQATKSSHQSSFTEPYNDAFTKELLITATAPVMTGGFKGIVGGDLNLKTLSDTLNKIDFKGLGHAFLIDQQGKILAHPESGLANKNLSELYGQPVKINTDLQPVTTEKGPRILSFHALPGIDSINWYVAIDVDTDKAYASLYDFRNSVIISTLLVALLTSLVLWLVLKQVTQPLFQLRNALFDIAQGEGDLTQRLPVTGTDKFGQVATAFNAFVGNIHGLIEDFRGSAENLMTMVRTMKSVSEQSRKECAKQQQETDMVAAAVSEMSSAAQEIASHAQGAADAAQDADREGSQAGRVVQDAIQSIHHLAKEIQSTTDVITELETDVTNISSMVDVIRGIAEQTNLLALNAAIEAARAGEQGRGFAVVADEVRTLASKTQDSTQEINRLIERLQGGSKQAVAVMTSSREAGESTVAKANEAGHSLQSIASAVSTISSMNIQIATASEEQTAVTEDIARNVTAIADATASVTLAAREIDDNSQRLSEIAASIQEKVSRFRV